MFHNISNPKWFGNWSRLEDDYLGNGGTDIADNFTFSKMEKTGGLFGSIIRLGKELLAGEKHLFERHTLEALKEKLDGRDLHFETTVSKKQENPPLPYNLTVLLSDMSERFGFTAAETQQITQDLRDKYKAITYNRSDSQYLKEEHREQAPAVLAQAMKNLGVRWPLDYRLHSKAFNDGNVTAHHGIIPQEADAPVSAMEPDEAKVYTAICERYAVQFLPRGADVTARWWLIQQDIADGKADVNALQDSVIEVFNHHRETAYVGASIAGTGKTVVGKCPRCGKDVIKTGSIYACSSIKNEKQEDGTWKEVAGCGFKLFGFCTKKFTEKQAASLLDGKAVSLRGCKSKAGKTFDCKVVLQKDGSVEPIFTPRKPTKKGRR